MPFALSPCADSFLRLAGNVSLTRGSRAHKIQGIRTDRGNLLSGRAFNERPRENVEVANSVRVRDNRPWGACQRAECLRGIHEAGWSETSFGARRLVCASFDNYLELLTKWTRGDKCAVVGRRLGRIG
jgi:hypothetical protein